MTEYALAEALRGLADDVTAPQPPADLWRRGRRRRQRVTAAAVAAVLGTLVVAVPVVRPQEHPAAPPTVALPPAVRLPTGLSGPLPGLRTVQRSPQGPATVIATGQGSFRGGDGPFGGNEGRTVVLAANGRYRLVSGAKEGAAGTDSFLSPDGRWLAVAGPVDGNTGADFASTSLVTLATGEVRSVPDGVPLGFSPDSTWLAIGAANGGSVALVNTGSAQVERQLQTPGANGPARVSFDPEHPWIAVDLGARGVYATSYADPVEHQDPPPFTKPATSSVLAGPGAYTPSSLHSVAMWDVVSPGVFRLHLVDYSGGPGKRPTYDELKGQVPRLLGWAPDRTPVVEIREPGEPLTVVALRPGGGRRTLMRLPSTVDHVDVAAQLLTDGRFGAAPPSTAARLRDWGAGIVRPVGFTALVIATLAALWYARRQRRARR
jgi:hypothetical protein